jgi:hypothetical protein
MLTRMARTGGGSHGSIPLRLHQRKGSLAGADLAGTVRAIRLPAEAGDCRARFPGGAGSLTGAVLPRPPRRLCLQQHDTARDKVLFAYGPCRSVALQGMRPQSPADRRIWSVPCRGALSGGTNPRAGRSTTGNWSAPFPAALAASRQRSSAEDRSPVAAAIGVSAWPAACRKISSIWVARAAPVETSAA